MRAVRMASRFKSLRHFGRRGWVLGGRATPVVESLGPGVLFFGLWWQGGSARTRDTPPGVY